MPEATGLFETHLTVSDLDRSIAFYRDVVGLPLALELPERGAAFLWIGGETGDARQTTEPSVIDWMPAAAVYFRDPDGHLIEYLAMLDEPARPERGIMPWSVWGAPEPE
jgi:lactoylglutathione lyase